MLAVACSRCERRDRYRLDTLIARHGADVGARVIVPELTAGCLRRDNAALMERCDVLFPDVFAALKRIAVIALQIRRPIWVESCHWTNERHKAEGCAPASHEVPNSAASARLS